MERFKIGGAMGETFFSVTVVCGSNEEYSKVLAFINENNLIFLSEKIKMGGFLQRNWRPVMMLTFAGLMVAHWFGFTAPNIPESVQNSLLNIILVGIGVYTVGRSEAKVASNFGKGNK